MNIRLVGSVFKGFSCLSNHRRFCTPPASRVASVASAALFFTLCSLLAMGQSSVTSTQHYLYAVDGGAPATLWIYDIDSGFNLLKQTTIPIQYTGFGIQGFVISASTGMLYISHGCYYDLNSYCKGVGGYLTKYNLATNQIVWDRSFPFGVSSFSVSPDGQKIYMPVGERSSSTAWEVIDSNGNVMGSIDGRFQGPNNTIVSNSGAHVYMGPLLANYLVVASTSTDSVTQNIGPTLNGVGPFTINSKETLAFTTSTDQLGFQVGDVSTGKILFTVLVSANFAAKCPTNMNQPCSHGISLSPDDKEIYLVDKYNNYVHVFDVTGLPNSSPLPVADIPLAHAYTGEGWITHSRDSRYAFVGDSGDVIDTSTHAVVAYMPALNQTNKFQELWLQNGSTTFASLSRSGVGYVNPSSSTLSLSSTSLTFSAQTIGTTSAPQTVTLSNTGGSAVSVSSISITGADAGDFHQTNNCGASLTAQSKCTISVTFSPTSSGSRTASLTIADSDPSSPQSITLTGTGVSSTTGPVASTSPTKLTFLSQTIGTASASQSVTLSNSGGSSLSITSISITGDFSLTDNCGASLAAGVTCTINVTFKPTAAGTRTGVLSVADNAAGSPQTVSLTGTGASSAAPVVSVAPTALAFGSQTVNSTSAAQTATLGNTGNASLTISGITVSGDFAETNTCGASVSAGSQCAISVTFKPTAAGTRTGAVTISDNASGGRQTINLSGVGVSSSTSINHYEYVVMPDLIYVYDMDNGFALSKTLSIPQTHSAGPTQLRGAVGNAATGMFYISYGSDTSGGSLLKFDLKKNSVVWSQTYSFGVDSISVSPDGTKIYLPTGEGAYTQGVWQVIDTSSGNPVGQVNSGGGGPHNTTTNFSGTHIYLGPRYTNNLVLASTSPLSVIRNIGPVSSGVRPFTINSAETLAFITTTGQVGFYTADINTGKILFWTCPAGYCWTSGSYNGISGVSHGISLSPDETEIYLLDLPYNRVHVFNVTQLPGTAPVDVADIPLNCKLSQEGWLQHSRDGRFVIIGNCGDVIDTSTRKIVANMPQLLNTRIWNQVDFRNGVPYFSPLSRNQGGYKNQPY